MYFSYVPSIIFSFFNRPLFLNLLFKQILIQYYSILFNRVLNIHSHSLEISNFPLARYNTQTQQSGWVNPLDAISYQIQVKSDRILSFGLQKQRRPRGQTVFCKILLFELQNYFLIQPRAAHDKLLSGQHPKTLCSTWIRTWGRELPISREEESPGFSF